MKLLINCDSQSDVYPLPPTQYLMDNQLLKNVKYATLLPTMPIYPATYHPLIDAIIAAIEYGRNLVIDVNDIRLLISHNVSPIKNFVYKNNEVSFEHQATECKELKQIKLHKPIEKKLNGVYIVGSVEEWTKLYKEHRKGNANIKMLLKNILRAVKDNADASYWNSFVQVDGTTLSGSVMCLVSEDHYQTCKSADNVYTLYYGFFGHHETKDGMKVVHGQFVTNFFFK